MPPVAPALLALLALAAIISLGRTARCLPPSADDVAHSAAMRQITTVRTQPAASTRSEDEVSGQDPVITTDLTKSNSMGESIAHATTPAPMASPFSTFRSPNLPEATLLRHLPITPPDLDAMLKFPIPLKDHVKVSKSDIGKCRETITEAVAAWNPDQRKRGLTLLIYHVGNASVNFINLEFQFNNLKTFTSANSNASAPIFYIFQIHLGRAQNIYTLLLPLTALGNHACVVDVPQARYDMSPLMLTLGLLQDVVVPNFKYVFLMNQNTRGPLTLRKDSQWLELYRSVFEDFAVRKRVSVGILGPTISCAHSPHVQTHAWMISTSVVPIIVAYQLSLSFVEITNSMPFIDHVEVGMSRILFLLGYSLASIESLAKYGDPFVYCSQSQPKQVVQVSGSEATVARQLVFYKSGGSSLRHFCEKNAAILPHQSLLVAAFDAASTHKVVAELENRLDRRIIGAFLTGLHDLGLDVVSSLTSEIAKAHPGLLHYPEVFCASGISEKVLRQRRFG